MEIYYVFELEDKVLEQVYFKRKCDEIKQKKSFVFCILFKEPCYRCTCVFVSDVKCYINKLGRIIHICSMHKTRTYA